MRNRLGNKANALFLALAVGSVVVLACGGGDDAAAPQNDGGTGSDTSTPTDGGGEGSTGRIDIDGTLLGTPVTSATGFVTLTDPITSRDLVIVDADGNVTKTTSGIGGKFHVPNVAAPYDIFITYIAADANDSNAYVYYAGLTRSDPTVVGAAYVVPDYTIRAATATVTIPSSCATCNVFVSYPAPIPPVVLTGFATSQPYGNINIRWYGPADATMPVHFYAQDTATGMFVKSGDSASMTFHDGQNTALGTVTLSTVPANSAVNLSWPSLPAGYDLKRLDLDIFGPDLSNLATFKGALDGGGLVTHMPSSPNLAALLNASASSSAGIYSGAVGTVLTNADFSLAIDSPPGPTLLTPADHATGISSSDTFSWSAVDPNVIYSVQLSCGVASVGIATKDTSVSLARLAKAGLTLPPSTSCYWNVYLGQNKTVDDYASPPQAPYAPSPVQPSGASNQQTFTTQ